MLRVGAGRLQGLAAAAQCRAVLSLIPDVPALAGGREQPTWGVRSFAAVAADSSPAPSLERTRWWNSGQVTSAPEAYYAFITELKAKKNVRDRALQEVLSRCENPTDAGLALKAIRTLRRHRAALQMHDPFTAHTTRTLMEAMLRCNASDVAAAAVAQRVTLGLPLTLKQVERVLRALGASKDWAAVSKIARDLKESGMGTNSCISYVIARTAAETGHLREGKRLIAALDPDSTSSPPSIKLWLTEVTPPVTAAATEDTATDFNEGDAEGVVTEGTVTP